jgi:hypothetical protein
MNGFDDAGSCGMLRYTSPHIFRVEGVIVPQFCLTITLGSCGDDDFNAKIGSLFFQKLYIHMDVFPSQLCNLFVYYILTTDSVFSHTSFYFIPFTIHPHLRLAANLSMFVLFICHPVFF